MTVRRISVCILAGHCAGALDACLMSLRGQIAPPPFEFLAGGGSPSKEAVAVVRAHVPDAQICDPGRRLPGAARNPLIDRAQGELLLFLEGDVAVQPDLLRCLGPTRAAMRYAPRSIESRLMPLAPTLAEIAMAERLPGRVITFGSSPAAMLRAAEIRSSWPEPLSFTLHHRGRSQPVRTRLHGKHWVPSVLGAIGAAVAMDVPHPGSASTVYRRLAGRALQVADEVIFAGPQAPRALRATRGPRTGSLLTFATAREAVAYVTANLREDDLVLLKGSERADGLHRIRFIGSERFTPMATASG